MASIAFPLLVFVVGLILYAACSPRPLKDRIAIVGLALLIIGAAVITLGYAGHVSRL